MISLFMYFVAISSAIPNNNTLSMFLLLVTYVFDTYTVRINKAICCCWLNYNIAKKISDKKYISSFSLKTNASN